jgi:hypothetical protein
MLQKAKERHCYGDVIVEDVTVFIRNYADGITSATTATPIATTSTVEQPFAINSSVASATAATTAVVSPRTTGVREGEAVAEVAEETASVTAVGADEINSNNSQNNNNPLLDFIIAADVFMYLGDLTEVLIGCRRSLQPETGLLVFTVESLSSLPLTLPAKSQSSTLANDEDKLANATAVPPLPASRSILLDDDNNKLTADVAAVPTEDDSTTVADNFRLQPSGRIAHSYSYLMAVAKQTGFDIVEITAAIPRKDKGVPVQGYLVVLSPSLVAASI